MTSTTTAAPTNTITPAPSAPESKGTPAAKPNVETRELTVNGKKVKMTVDEAFAFAQKGTAADEKFRTATETAERAEQALAKIKDPAELEAILESLGANPDEIAAVLYESRQKKKKALEDDAKLTPEQRELKELRALKAEQDAIKKEAEDKKKEREDKVKYDTSVTMIATSIKKALTEIGLPETPENVGWVARALQDLKKTDDGIVQGKVKLSKLIEMMQNRGKTHFQWASQGYDPVRILELIPEEKREALLVEYLKQKGSKKATPKGDKPALSGQSPAEQQIRRGMKFIA